MYFALNTDRVWVEGGKTSNIKRTGPGCSSYLLGVKKMVLVPIRVFSLKRPREGTFSGFFEDTEQKNCDRRYLTVNFASRRHSKQWFYHCY